MAGDTKQWGPRRLFGERMKREGRYNDWQKRITYWRKEGGLQWTPASWRAMYDFGYVNAAQEREFARIHEESLLDEHIKDELRNESARHEESVARVTFDEIMEQLPATASAREELDWISSHPAMMREPDDDGLVTLTVADLTDANGEPPSRSAVGRLKHWCNNRSEFFKALMTTDRKAAGGDDTGKGSVKDEGVPEIEGLLESFSTDP